MPLLAILAAMAKDYSYRPKYMDIRVKPPGEDIDREKAKIRECDKDGCDKPGEHPAPKKSGRGKYYFCKTCAREYNKNFNFFDGMSAAEAKKFAEDERHGHKRTWKFGTGPAGKKRAAAMHDPRKWKGRGIFDEDDVSAATNTGAPRGRTRLQLRALTELDLKAEATPAEIRARYSEYVRRFHPDRNDGDRSSEDKLNRVIRAFKMLKAAGLTED